MKFRLTLVSSNKKTGPIPVSTTSADSCPDNCSFKLGGCYAASGPLAIIWKQTEKLGMDIKEFCNKIKSLPKNQLWRHNQAGDLAGLNNQIDFSSLAGIINANKGKKGFTYTHKPLTKQNIEYIKIANNNGFTVNISADSEKQADYARKLGLPTVLVVDSNINKNFTTKENNKVVICPATQRDNVTCLSCRLCQKANRSCIVGFPAHGTGKGKVNKILKDKEND